MLLRRNRVYWPLLCAILAVSLIVSILFLVDANKEQLLPALPTELKITAVEFSQRNVTTRGTGFSFTIIPAYISEDYIYELVVSPQNAGGTDRYAIQLEPNGGVLSGTISVPLSTQPYWNVTLYVSNGKDSVAVPVAWELRWSSLTPIR